MTAAAPPRPLFVLGGHRGGTTLLQRVLNSYDDVVVWGEHEGALTPIAAAYFRGVESPQLFRDVRPSKRAGGGEWQAWMTPVTRSGWDDAYRELVRSLFRPADANGVRFWGFKEIRYGTLPDDRAIEFLATLFPDACFAFLVRNPFNMLASARSRPEGPRTRRDVVRVCDRLATRFSAFHRWHTSGRLRSQWVVYEELCRGEGGIHGLAAALGHEVGPAQRAVIASEGEGRGSSFHDADVNERWRRLPPAWLALAGYAVGPVARALGYAVPPVAAWRRALAPIVWHRAGGRALDARERYSSGGGPPVRAI